MILRKGSSYLRESRLTVKDKSEKTIVFYLKREPSVEEPTWRSKGNN
jgi:hypothetical protein